ncbi:branched-chain amino acid ABC transporter permease [Nakamurella sp. YIM 132087]|uniref:Branched-chain amino acid ABC transporter permease n=2 Tax=Nakamurella alba TaxID=2665158 RepID=A0A7K1FLY9_9ACTN|nr:branched-chain amino acid ABC transporter permease [Nakamurella alba]
MNGLIQGSVFALAAIGLSLIFGVVRVPHFAHGESVMLGGMVALTVVTSWGGALLVGIAVGVVAAIAFGCLIQVILYHPLRRRDETNLLICALAVVLIVPAISFKIWGDAPRIIPVDGDRVVEILGARATTMKLVIVGVTLLLTLALMWFVGRTRWGRAMKAMALNQYAARLMGIPTLRYSILAFAIGSALAGLGGALLGTIQPVQVDMGATLVLKSFIIIIFAGMGSIGGAWVGGVLLGLVEAFGGSFLSSAWIDTYSFVFLLAVLLVRPQGLFTLARARD